MNSNAFEPIVCGEWDIGPVSENLSLENEVVLEVRKIINHPDFDVRKGLTNGADISVYFVDDSPLKLDGVIDKKKIYPACLPTRAHLNKRGILAGWADPLEFGIFYPENSPGGSSTAEENINEYREKHLIMKHVELEVGECKDPEWMGSNSYHPKG